MSKNVVYNFLPRLCLAIRLSKIDKNLIIYFKQSNYLTAFPYGSDAFAYSIFLGSVIRARSMC